MQDKQIYAYSWRRELIKNIRDYLNKRKVSKTTIDKQKGLDTHEIKKNKNEIISRKVDADVYTKELNQKSKIDTPPKTKVTKKTKGDYKSHLISKEKKETLLTYVIGTLIIIVIILGIVMGSGIVSFTPRKVQEIYTTNQKGGTENNKNEIETVSRQPTSVTINKPQPARENSGCRVSGCNNEICADESLGNISSICIYNEKYTCYQNATCEKQQDGKCGWTETLELRTCLEQH